MERILVKTYKGRFIFYDVDNDKFVCSIEFDDEKNGRESSRKSLKDIMHRIDLFIKENSKFKPFLFFRSRWGGDDIQVFNCSSIRTDGRLVVHEPNDKYKDTISLSGTDKMYEYNEDIHNLLLIAEKKLDDAKEEYRKSKKELMAKLKPIDLSQFEGLIKK